MFVCLWRCVVALRVGVWIQSCIPSCSCTKVRRSGHSSGPSITRGSRFTAPLEVESTVSTRSEQQDLNNIEIESATLLFLRVKFVCSVSMLCMCSNSAVWCQLYVRVGSAYKYIFTWRHVSSKCLHTDRMSKGVRIWPAMCRCRLVLDDRRCLIYTNLDHTHSSPWTS